jgi:hypothetical protein
VFVRSHLLAFTCINPKLTGHPVEKSILFHPSPPASAVIGDREFGNAPASQEEHSVPKNPKPPQCPKCYKPMHFMLVKTGGRKFRCIDCDVPDPLHLPEVAKLLKGALRSPE